MGVQNLTTDQLGILKGEFLIHMPDVFIATRCEDTHEKVALWLKEAVVESKHLLSVKGG